MGDARDRSLARRAEDVDVVAVRGERGDQPGRRALDAAVEDEGAGDDQEAHCSGGRGAGAIGGWPETRSDPAAFRMPQLIPRKGGRGAGAIGGWPETRSDPAAFRMPQLIPRKGGRGAGAFGRSEEHTSELQSRLHLVCRLLLEKKKHSRLSAPRTISRPQSPDRSCRRRARVPALPHTRHGVPTAVYA